MNRSFTKEKLLVLDEKHSIKPDSDNGVILICVGEPKQNKKGETVSNITEFHFPRIAQALRKYADLNLNNNLSFDSLIFELNKIYSVIDSIDSNFKQF